MVDSGEEANRCDRHAAGMDQGQADQMPAYDAEGINLKIVECMSGTGKGYTVAKIDGRHRQQLTTFP